VIFNLDPEPAATLEKREAMQRETEELRGCTSTRCFKLGPDFVSIDRRTGSETVIYSGAFGSRNGRHRSAAAPELRRVDVSLIGRFVSVVGD
jgi:hypothetical protein